MFDISEILKSEYVSYFSLSPYIKNDTILDNFLNDMINISENIDSTQIPYPTQILVSIKEKLSMEEKNMIETIYYIIENNYQETLTVLELFAIIWYLSCRNIFSFSKTLYHIAAEKGLIGKFLNESSLKTK
ncbi:MAG: hypothetical protein IJW82_05205 [Clostridia bacterium]|nr:hypothetical protein [Clostridia bacterium]